MENLKKVSVEELEKKAEEIRKKLIETVSKNGGHLAPNLGVVELTLCLHKVFDFTKDKLLFDVGHQRVLMIHISLDMLEQLYQLEQE